MRENYAIKTAPVEVTGFEKNQLSIKRPINCPFRTAKIFIIKIFA